MCLNGEFKFDRPLKELIEPLLQQKQFKKQKKRQWYSQPPEWLLLKGKSQSDDHKLAKTQEWKKLMQELESSHADGRSKEFFGLVRKATSLQSKGCPVKEIIKNDEHILDKDQITQIVKEYYSDLLWSDNQSEPVMQQWNLQKG